MHTTGIAAYSAHAAAVLRARSETVRRCSQASRETYSALPLASPETEGADTLEAAFGSIEANPFGFYANVRARDAAASEPGSIIEVCCLC